MQVIDEKSANACIGDKVNNHERSKDCIVLNFRLLINQNAKKMTLPAQPF